MKINIGTYSFGGMETYMGLGMPLKEKFALIKSLGFDGVELLPPDLNDNDPADVKKWAEEAGLEITSIHAEPTEEIVQKLAAAGGKVCIWASTPFCNKEEAIEVAHQLDEMADMAAKYGIKVGYHNHSQEFFFDQGKVLLQHVIDNSSKCYFQLDCGWAQNGGCYPPTFIRKNKNRIIAIHVKENSRVQGPGPRPASRHEQKQGGAPWGDITKLSVEERKQILANIQKNMDTPESRKRFEVQCKMGAPESNMNWQEIKNALDEQDFEAFWVIEREGFYDEHDKCIAEDAAYVHEHVK